MITRLENGVTWTSTYNAENRLATMSDGTTTWLFSYDGDGNRVSHLITDGTTTSGTFYFMGGGFEVSSDGTTQSVRKYYSIAGTTYAMSNNGTMNYLITDHLSSVVAVTDASGLLLEETRYMPFGGVRSDVGTITGTDKSFTGQKVLPDTGLLDYNARMYSSELGRFTQPDTIIPGVGNSQAWNRYSYTLNNPVGFTDPSGHSPTDGCQYEGCSSTPTDTHKIRRKTAELKIGHFENVVLNGSISDYSISELEMILKALEIAAAAHGGNEKFAKDYGPIHFSVFGYVAIEDCVWKCLVFQGGIAPPGSQTILITSDMLNKDEGVFNILHEMAHVYDARPGRYNYRSNDFVKTFSPGSCLPGFLGCIANEHIQEETLSLYKFFNLDARGYYRPSGIYARDYSRISSLDDFADSYAVVVMNQSFLNAPYPIDTERTNLINGFLSR